MELVIFDKQLNYLGIVDSFHSFRRVRRYNKAGEFELHISFTLEAMQMMQLGNIVWQKGDNQAGYIRTRNINLASDGGETLVINGLLMSGYLNKRIVWGRENISGSSEYVMRQLVERHAISPVDNARKIPLLQLADNKGISGSVRKQATYRNLLEVIEEVAASSGLGFQINVDVNNKRLLFDTYEGVDRSRRAVFSREFENVLEQEYVESNDNYRNAAIVAGTGEGAERKTTALNTDLAGLERLELYVDAKDIEDTKTVNDEEIAIPENEYLDLLKNRGLSKLAETTKVESFNSKIHPQANLIYRVDYDLGDIVTVRDNEWGLMVDERITEVEEVYEEDGFNIFLVFGEEPIGILDKIKQVVS